jgi:hypothetical protein
VACCEHGEWMMCMGSTWCVFDIMWSILTPCLAVVALVVLDHLSVAIVADL